jgi:HEAT repeat protein
MDPAVYDRLEAIEQSINELNGVAERLMDRGTVPLAERRVAEMIARLNDFSASDRDRIEALRLLRRNDALDDAGVASALHWLQGATNAATRRSILQNLEGMTNYLMRTPLLQLALNEPNAATREQAVDTLGRFVSDPVVEAQLLQIMRGDAERRVRDEAASALRRGPMTDARVATFQQLALDENLELRERLNALRALRGREAEISTVLGSLARQAQEAEDARVRAELFQAFDGYDDPALLAPLVHGLQDPNPVVRERAADALSGFRSEPVVQEWLQYLMENDADQRVRREAFQSLGD